MSNEDNPTRDRRGRWRKGVSPNPAGRPRKEPEISDADIRKFKNTLVDVTINGEVRSLTRQEVLMHAMYEQAVKGKSVLVQRKLFDLFHKTDEEFALLHLRLQDFARHIAAETRQGREIDEAKFADFCFVYNAITGRDFQKVMNQPRKPPRSRVRHRPSTPAASWRRGPKPETLLALERAEEAAEAAYLAELATPGADPEDPNSE